MWKKLTEKLICSFLFSFCLFCGLQYRMSGTLFSAAPGRWLLQHCCAFFPEGASASAVILTSAIPIVIACLLLLLMQGTQAVVMSVRSRRHPAGHTIQIRRIPHRTQWLLIFAAWLPYLLLRYPAGIDWDAYHQIAQSLGMEEMTSHWPPFVAWLMG